MATDKNDTPAAETDGQEQTPSELRKQLENTLKENKALKAENSKLVADRDKDVRAKTLADKGFKPEAAEFVPEDAWTDPRKLDEFLAERAWLAQEKRQEAIDAHEAEEAEVRGLTPDQAEAFRSVQRMAAESGDSPSDLAGLKARMQAAKSPAELDDVTKNFKLS